MKKLKTKLMLVLAIFGLFFVTGCDDLNTQKFEEKDFSITLSTGFYKKDYVGFNYYYESPKAIVTVLKEELNTLAVLDFDENTPLEEYGKAVLKTNMLKEDSLKTREDYMYFTYQKEVSGKDYYYMGIVKKGDDAFWLINFACLQKDKDTMIDTFHEWATSAKVN